jgi:hypothetical protein
MTAVWLIDACAEGRAWLGVSGTPESAQTAARALLDAGAVAEVKVERALVAVGSVSVSDGYTRTGHGWLVRQTECLETFAA